jgi:hypothetical protein
VESADKLAEMSSQISAINGVTGGLAQFSGFVKSHFGIFLIAMGIYLVWRGRFIIKRTIVDLVSGRYFPAASKEGGT